jgi:DNA primase
MRAWLHLLCNRAAERHPDLLTVAAHDADRGNRVPLSVTRMGLEGLSSLPYSVAGNPELGMATPVKWNELGEIANGTYTAHNSAQRLQRDVFAEMTTAIGVERFSSLRA